MANVCTSTIETGWVQLSEIAGYQRIKDFYLVGKINNPEAISCEISYNGKGEDLTPEPEEVISIDLNKILDRYSRGSTLSDITLWRFAPRRQRCSSMKLKFMIRCSSMELSAIKFGVQSVKETLPTTGAEVL